LLDSSVIWESNLQPKRNTRVWHGTFTPTFTHPHFRLKQAPTPVGRSHLPILQPLRLGSRQGNQLRSPNQHAFLCRSIVASPHSLPGSFWPGLSDIVLPDPKAPEQAPVPRCSGGHWQCSSAQTLKPLVDPDIIRNGSARTRRPTRARPYFQLCSGTPVITRDARPGLGARADLLHCDSVTKSRCCSGTHCVTGSLST
jgi:hypothetical protein